MSKDINIDEIAINLEVDSGVIDRVRNGEVTHIISDINEDNQKLILENINGNLILVTDVMPTIYHACYFYNNGEFPYVIKDSLQFLLLTEGEKSCLTRIIGKSIKPGTRFRYKVTEKSYEEDPNGDSCIWEVSFEILPINDEHRTYLMRWNPAISSYKETDYEESVANMESGLFHLNWSIHEWEEARRGDIFYMMRVGDDKAGIVFKGQFVSDPYVMDDWAGTSKRKLYVDMVCMKPVKPGKKPLLELSKLQDAIPEIDWSKGHSGILLSSEVAEKLDELWKTVK